MFQFNFYVYNIYGIKKLVTSVRETKCSMVEKRLGSKVVRWLGKKGKNNV